MDYEKLMAKARKTNTQRDEGERGSGFAAPGDSGSFDLLRTAFMAIECGIKTDDWNAVAEGQAMIEIIIDKYASKLTATTDYIARMVAIKMRKDDK